MQIWPGPGILFLPPDHYKYGYIVSPSQINISIFDEYKKTDIIWHHLFKL